ncbi:MAG: 4Fe-4S dicluster domain-containing protein [Acidaminococcaceae bacterium]
MELTEVTKLRREVLTRLSKYTFEGTLLDKVYDILYEVVTEDTPRYRCCVHKERAVLKNRICMALGLKTGINIIEASKIALVEPVDRSLPIIDVLSEACTQCPIEKYLVTDACRHCIAHKCMNSCPKKAISIHLNRAYINKNECIECGKCKSVCPFGAIIEISRPCERACALDAIHPGVNHKAELDRTKCVECGSCRSACPFGAIDERSSIVQLIQTIKSGKQVVAMLAPSFIAQFGVKVTPGQILAGLLKMGFAEVTEVAAGADMTVIHEAEEFLAKVPAEQAFMTNSCCPAFVELIHKHLPELADKISTTVSPMVACGEMVKALNPEAVTVFIGPCIAKKVEGRQYPEAIDFVLTYEEIACMLAGANIVLSTMPDKPFVSIASKLGNGFPLFQGVGKAVAATVATMTGRQVKATYCAGLVECREALQKLNQGELDADYFEGMSCLRGCIDGPGALVDAGISRVFMTKFLSAVSQENATNNELAQAALSKVKMER